jgi:hypothetical protein
VLISYVDNEERLPGVVDPVGPPLFSPPPVSLPATLTSLPYEVNVLRVNGSDALRSALTDSLVDDAVGTFAFDHGWSTVFFVDSVGLSGTDLETNLPATQEGFPVIGFSFERVNGNGVMDAIEANYSRSTQ